MKRILPIVVLLLAACNGVPGATDPALRAGYAGVEATGTETQRDAAARATQQYDAVVRMQATQTALPVETVGDMGGEYAGVYGEQMIDWRKINKPKRYTPNDLMKLGEKTLAVRRLNQAVKNGTMTRAGVCEIHPSHGGPTVAHHWNGHTNWFDVWWVCYWCNKHLTCHDGTESIEWARVRLLYSAKDGQSDLDSVANKKESKRLVCDGCGIRALMGDMIRIPNDQSNPYLANFLCEVCCFKMTGS